MNNYRINYIDSFDKRYKSFETAAKTKEDALEQLRASYKHGTPDHHIAEIIKLNEPAISGMRIGEELNFYVPFVR